MECTHVEECFQVAAPPVKEEKQSHCPWICTVCKTAKSPWMCLHCGYVGCGRYVNGHAKQHYEDTTNSHSLCIDCDNWAVFCYNCDEFVINDTTSGHIDQVRKQLQALNSAHTSVKENREKLRRKCTQDSVENNKKKLKTDAGSRKKSSKPRASGLRNLGNTCFMNAVLQSLSNIQQFCGYIKQLPSLENHVTAKKKQRVTRKNGGEEDVFLVEELRKTLIALWQGSKSAISPDSLFSVIWKVVPRFRGYQQQDAHEFMRYLLDRLHTELLTLLPYPAQNSTYIGSKGKSSIVTAIFGGILQNEVTCLVCGMESKKHDPFLDLSLDIPIQFSTRNSKDPDNRCHVTDCLSSFTELEELEESELYKCNHCKVRQRSTKRFWIRRLPNVLCLHLKRFRWSTFCRVKVETHVEFPLRGLDMKKYMLNSLHGTRTSSGGNEYDLAAVIVHHGSGAGSGHYTAYVTHEGQWFHFNDSTVTVCDEETVVKCKAYILFYVRRELKLPSYLNESDDRPQP